jgi:hypothetical protein
VFYALSASKLLDCATQPTIAGSVVEKVTDVLDDSHNIHDILFALQSYTLLAAEGKTKVDKSLVASLVDRITELQSKNGAFHPSDKVCPLIFCHFILSVFNLLRNP